MPRKVGLGRLRKTGGSGIPPANRLRNTVAKGAVPGGKEKPKNIDQMLSKKS